MAAVTGARPGTGTTLTLATNTYAILMTSVSHNGYGRPALDSTVLASTDREYTQGDLTEPGQLEFEFLVDPTLLDSMKTALEGGAQTTTITFDQETGETSAGTFAASGFITDHSITIANEELITGTMTIKLSGDVTFTDAA